MMRDEMSGWDGQQRNYFQPAAASVAGLGGVT